MRTLFDVYKAMVVLTSKSLKLNIDYRRILPISISISFGSWDSIKGFLRTLLPGGGNSDIVIALQT